MLGIEELSPKDRTIVRRGRRLQQYPAQPFHVTAAHTGMPGDSVALGDTLDNCDAFLSGRYDELPEEACYIRGSMKPRNGS